MNHFPPASTSYRLPVSQVLAMYPDDTLCEDDEDDAAEPSVFGRLLQRLGRWWSNAGDAAGVAEGAETTAASDVVAVPDPALERAWGHVGRALDERSAAIQAMHGDVDSATH